MYARFILTDDSISPHSLPLPCYSDGTEIVEVTTAVVAGPPDMDASSPAGGDGVVVVTSDGDAHVNGESEIVSPTDASDEHVTVVSSPGMFFPLARLDTHLRALHGCSDDVRVLSRPLALCQAVHGRLRFDVALSLARNYGTIVS